MANVSTLLLTLNEEQNLPACLDALSWCDDIWVLDSFSTDATVEIARSAGAHVMQRKFDSFAGQRNYGLERAGFRHEWILHLDADEICTEELHQEILQRTNDAAFDAYRIPSKTMFMDKWVKRSGMYPTYQVRLGRHPEFQFKQVGHGQREDVDPARVGTLQSPYLHYSFSKGLSEWFEKHNRYSTLEAMEALQTDRSQDLDVAGLFSLKDATRRRRALKQLSYRVSFRPTLRFLYMYLLRGGILDGRAGYSYCHLLSIYEAMIDAKVAEFGRHAASVRETIPMHREPAASSATVPIREYADTAADVRKAA